MKKRLAFPIFILFIAIFISTILGAQDTDDPWLFLEEVDGINPLAWVDGQNQRTADTLKSRPEFAGLYQQALEVLDSESRIPSVSQRGTWLYNLWNDSAHPRGLYRRTTLDEFRKADPIWETVVDIGALSQKEGKPWVFQEIRCLPDAYAKCLFFLSLGGTDASEVREFDIDTLSFVADGFFFQRQRQKFGGSMPTIFSSAPILGQDH